MLLNFGCILDDKQHLLFKPSQYASEDSIPLFPLYAPPLYSSSQHFNDNTIIFMMLLLKSLPSDFEICFINLFGLHRESFQLVNFLWPLP